MFEEKKSSKKSLILLLILFIIILGSNALGYFLARDQLDSALAPTRLPEGEPLPFSRTFRVILPEFSVQIPFEVSGFSLNGAYPFEMTLHYDNVFNQSSMNVTISDRKFFYHEQRPIRFPESILVIKGLSGSLLHEIFAQGVTSDGISINPYRAIREGLAARIRGALSKAAAPAKIDRISVAGDSKNGQIWRFYKREDGNTALIEGAIYKEDKIANVSIQFTGKTPKIGPIIKSFSKAFEFVNGDVAKNETLEKSCLSDQEYDMEPLWERGCRQAHLVANLISKGDSLDIADRLYAEYVAQENRNALRAIHAELYYEMHAVDGWEKLIKKIESQNSWLLMEKKDKK